ncbi:hypothetical protein [Polaromonas jejuensis]|uniref:Uncharacterized protein n=1 Tax=Polaromonas jejuensis TaxID=457502 RepID=A0ABW0QHA9_9BURK|nr:hypothetical protein [Polaromonas jejuensis]
MSDTTFAIASALAMFALLGVIYVVHHWREARRNPSHLTADPRAMDRQVRQLQAQVPSAERRRVRAGQPPAPQPLPPTATAAIRAAAVAAALRDAGTPLRTPNPHEPGTWAASVWGANYHRVRVDHLVANRLASQSRHAASTDAQA